MTEGLELDDMQGNVAYGYNFPRASYLLFHFPGHGAVCPFFGEIADQVTNGRDRPGEVAVNVALSCAGLARAGVAAGHLATFPVEFRDGMRLRSAGVLGDGGASDPEHWEVYRRPAAPDGSADHVPVHLLAIVHGRERGALDSKVNEICRAAALVGAECLHREDTAVLRGDQRRDSEEHFGFKDGISQPPLTGTTKEAAGGGALDKKGKKGKWRQIAAGEFVLGYADEEDPHPPLPRPWELARNGSYLVYRKIEQDVPGFRAFLEDLGARDEGAKRAINDAGRRDILAAKFIGRFPAGTPLVPQDRPKATGAPPPSLNDFRYADDSKGHRCPLGSHIRRANPRDELNFVSLVQRHRLIRRGMPYGPPYDPETQDDRKQERGLIFVAYCASIGRQYEFVQSQWINGGDALGIGSDPDPILSTASPATAFVVQGCPPRLLRLADRDHPRKPLVKIRWGEYFFQPGIRALRWLSLEKA